MNLADAFRLARNGLVDTVYDSDSGEYDIYLSKSLFDY